MASYSVNIRCAVISHVRYRTDSRYRTRSGALEGTNVEEGRGLLSNTGHNIYAADDLAHAAEQVVALAETV